MICLHLMQSDDMDATKDMFRELDHSISVLNQMMKSLEIGQENNLIDNADLTELRNYLEGDESLEHYSLPTLFGRIFFQEASLVEYWLGFSKLSIIDRKLLFFTIAGHDQDLIIESLNLTNSADYWTRLTELKKEYSRLTRVDFDEEKIKKMNEKLRSILDWYLELSDQMEKEDMRSKSKFQWKYIGLSSGVILVLAYVFLWNFVISPSGQEICETRIDPVILSVNLYTDSIPWLPYVMSEIESREYRTAMDILEEELLMSDSMPVDFQVLLTLMMIRDGRYSDSRKILRDIRYGSKELYALHLKGLIWKIRFIE